ncbi:MAG TPA: hypothetical protein VHA12_02345 [Candidatus Nanoarchaeia archaeon]|nr:hypothetical protein [Candidatus Nanoarchaeia archaeon]
MNSADLDRTKQQILSHISQKGPSLPATIAGEIRVQPLFVSAFLSELYREGKVLMSHLKVGTSSLYILPGQEKMLENFVQHLNTREREAYNLLKQKKVLKESELTPVIRVAIRDIKDFAKSEQINGDVQWTYIFAEPEEIKVSVEKEKTIPVQQAVQTVRENIEIIQQSQVQEQETKVEEKKQQVKKVKEKKPVKQESSFELTFNPSYQMPQQTTPLAEEAKNFLEKNNYSNITILKSDKKESTLKASIQGPNGMQTYLVFVKDKKKLKEEEIQLALQEAHSQRLLCLILARAEPDKKLSQFISAWNNFVAYLVF